MSKFERLTARLPGGDVDYLVGGDGRPVLYFHSAGGPRITPGLEKLASTCCLHIPIIPGFDDTPQIEGVASMQDIARLGAEFIDAVIGDRCDVIGQSFGGWAAPWLAILYPEKVDLLVLECPAGFRPADCPPPSNDPDMRDKQMFAHPDRRLPETRSAATLERNRAMLHHYHGPEARDEALIARLGDVAALTLILMGTEDGRVPRATGHMLKERLPHAYLVYVYDAAHSIETDQPDRFASLVGDFLRRGENFLVNQTRSANDAA